MADSIVGVAEPGSPTKKIDTTQLTVGVNTVERERQQVSGAAAAELADVRNAVPGTTDYGLVVRQVDRVVGGGTEAAAQRVTIANDSTGLVSVDDNGGSLTVDGSVSVSGAVDTELPAAAALADNTANPTAPAVAAFPHFFDGATWDRAVNGGGTEAAALRVTLANDSTGLVSVDDNSGSLTVDGSVSVSGTATVADASLDNASLVDNAAFTDGTTRVLMGGFVFDETAGTALTENDAAAARIDSKRAVVGVLEDGTTRGQKAAVGTDGALDVDVGRGRTLLFASIDTAASGDTTVVAADASFKIKVVSYAIVADAAVSVRWKDSAPTNLSGAMALAAGGGVAMAGTPGSWLLETGAINRGLIINLSAAIGVRGHISYFKEA